MDELIVSFLDFTATTDEEVAKQYLDLTGGNLEYAVQLFMESNQAPGVASNDEELAHRLQQEAYGHDSTRDADATVHRHETLMDSFDLVPQMPLPTDIFGNGRIGIFNQRFDDDENQYYENRVEELSDDDDEDDDDDQPDIIELDSDGEVLPTRPRNRRRRLQQSRFSELSSTQRRLANLFRPPFDIMERVDINGAKLLGRQQQKWILVNIQDSTEFMCQVLNRDFWSDDRIKDCVRQNFIFLQYQHDSPNGLSYKNFYSLEKYPHISILDPLTGERVHKFVEGSVPDVEEWLESVETFLNAFSLHPDSNNPLVHHEKKINPDEMSEEQQIEYAMKQSLTASSTTSITTTPQPLPEPISKSSFDSIEPREYIPNDSPSTRIQIRFPNGKRLIQKFNISDKVLVIYQWLKLSQNEYPRFNLSNSANRSLKLIESLDLSIQDAGLKNASLLLESE